MYINFLNCIVIETYNDTGNCYCSCMRKAESKCCRCCTYPCKQKAKLTTPKAGKIAVVNKPQSASPLLYLPTMQKTHRLNSNNVQKPNSRINIANADVPNKMKNVTRQDIKTQNMGLGINAAVKSLDVGERRKMQGVSAGSPRTANGMPLPDNAKHAITNPEKKAINHSINLINTRVCNPTDCGLLHYRKWWELTEVEISVNGKHIAGIPIFVEKNTLRVINNNHSYFIPLEKVDYIRTSDGLRSSFDLCDDEITLV